MERPEKELLVTATAIGDVGAKITGYYHYDKYTKAHFVCDKDSLYRYEVLPETVNPVWLILGYLK